MNPKNSTVYIYLDKVHPGINYTVKVMSRISGWTLLPVIDDDDLKEDHPAISYSREVQAALPLMQRSKFWDGMEDTAYQTLQNGNLAGLFPVNKGILSIDLIAFIFWSVSRYEEYNNKSLDNYGRFKATDSWAYRHELLNRPFIDEWVRLWQHKMTSLFSELEIPKRTIKNQPSLDIDYPYLFKHRSFSKKARVLISSVIKQRWGLIKDVLQGEDPYDTFDFVRSSFEGTQFRPYFFFLAHNNKFKEDRTLPLEHKAYQKVIEDLAKLGEVGIHPSLRSHDIPGQIDEEKHRLEGVISSEITHSRSHYLKLSMPDTYRNLILAGIHHDHTLGYPDQTGFRAGTAYPFMWYDLEKQKETQLKIHPLIVMDVSLKQYLGLDPEAAIRLIDELYGNMKNTGGEFSWLWHNSSFVPDLGWKNWSKVYLKLMDLEE